MKRTSDIGVMVEGGPRIGTGVTFVSDDGSARVEWGQIKDDATRVASALARLGVNRGSRASRFWPQPHGKR